MAQETLEFPKWVKRTRSFSVFVIATIIIVYSVFISGLRVNTTVSYPRGLYLVSENTQNLQRGEMIAFCPPESGVFKMAMERNYLPKGICPSGVQPLIKRIAGMPGDEVTIAETVSINGVEQKNSRPKPKDGLNNPLAAWPSGTVKDEHIFLLSSYSPDSFDSRYFGEIPVDWITGRVTPVLAGQE